MNWKLFTILIMGVVATLLLTAPGAQVAQAQNCETGSFTIEPSPGNHYNSGVSMELHGVSNCLPVRFEIDGVAQTQGNNGEQWQTLQTNSMLPGWHQACFSAYGTGGWVYRSCHNFFIRSEMNLVGAIAYSNCPAMDSRIDVGGNTKVSDVTPNPVPLRSLPGTNQGILVNIPVNTELTVLNGPVCATSWRWWQVAYAGNIGWVGEVGSSNLYDLNPIECPPHFVGLAIGDVAQITPGPSNRIRSGAGLGYLQVGTALPGINFTIIGGPICEDGMWWWLIEYPGNITGWTAEGNNVENWIQHP